MKRSFKALSLAMVAAISISGLAGCSTAVEPASATTSEMTAQKTEAMTAAAKDEAPEGTSEAEARTEGEWETKRPPYPC